MKITVRKRCIGPKVNIDLFIEIISKFEACKNNLHCVEICMKNILLQLMELAKDSRNIRVVENALRISVAEYRYQVEPKGNDITLLPSRDKKMILELLKREYES